MDSAIDACELDVPSRAGGEVAPLARLIAAAQGGSEGAWSELYARCLGRVRSLVWSHAGKRLLACEEPDDLVAEVFRALLEGLPHFAYRGDGAFIAWLSQLARSTLAERGKHHAARKRRPGVAVLPLVASGEEHMAGGRPAAGLSEDCLEAGGLSSAERGPAEEAAQRDEFAFVGRLARRLPAADRRVIALALDPRYGDDTQALGAALRISADAARMRWLRARRRLEALVAAHGARPGREAPARCAPNRSRRAAA